MFYQKSILKLNCMVTFFVFMIMSCASVQEKKPEVRMPMAFEPAVKHVANNLLQMAAKDIGEDPVDKVLVILDLFTDKHTGEVPEISKQIETIIVQEGGRNFEGFEFNRLNAQNLNEAHYIIAGNIGMDTFDDRRLYHLTGTIGNIKNAEVTGSSEAWISDTELDYKSMAIFRESPLYTQSEKTFPLADALKMSKQNGTDIFDSLETHALLVEATSAYEKGDYEKALSLFESAENKEDGKDLRTYAGLYLAYSKLGRTQEADTAFRKIVEVSVEKHRMLTVKFLFDVNTVEFIKDNNLRERYETWLRHIGEYFQNSRYCLKVTGHCSKTGSETWNQRLSLERAISIQQRLKSSFPDVMNRSKAYGRGYSENIIGTGADDDSDALDRRVELIIVDCINL